MSHDAVLIIKSTRGDGCTEVADLNVTYNYQPAFDAMGVKSLTVLDGMEARLAAIILRHMVTTLREHPEYGDLIRGNRQWGTLATLTELLERMLAVSEEWPEGTWQVT